MKKILIWLLVITFFSVGSIFLLWKWFEKYNYVNESAIEIFEGASVRQVSEILEVNGAIKNADVFYAYIRLKQFYAQYAPWSEKTFEVSFKPGKFKISSGDFDSLIKELNEAKNIIKDETTRFVTIPEGKTIEEMADIFEENEIVDKSTFLKIVNDKTYYNTLRKKYLWLPEYNNQKKYQLEGYLQANTFDFSTNLKPHEIIERMIEETNKWYEKHKIEISKSDYNFDELLTMASIVEKESKFSEDRPKVAQVFYNRLMNRMKLQSDITAAYALGEHKTYMTYDDIAVDSPYNTYIVDGLPIGPINSPSYESFVAALKPEGIGFTAFYFYARPSGETFYSETLEEHNEIKNKYDKEWRELE